MSTENERERAAPASIASMRSMSVSSFTHSHSHSHSLIFSPSLSHCLTLSLTHSLTPSHSHTNTHARAAPLVCEHARTHQFKRGDAGHVHSEVRRPCARAARHHTPPQFSAGETQDAAALACYRAQQSAKDQKEKNSERRDDRANRATLHIRHTHTHAHVHANIRTHMHTHANIRIRTHTRKHTHTHTRTHTRTCDGDEGLRFPQDFRSTDKRSAVEHLLKAIGMVIRQGACKCIGAVPCNGESSL